MSPDVPTTTYRCAACGALNRLQSARLFDDPKCGRCGEKVFPRRPVAVSDATFRDTVEQCPLPVLVDLWAPWCGPCRMIAPVLEQVAQERGGRLLVAKVNTDENPQTSARFGVRSIPTLLVMRGGQVVNQLAGALPKSQLDAWLDQSLR